jgi:hypothetical protein
MVAEGHFEVGEEEFCAAVWPAIAKKFENERESRGGGKRERTGVRKMTTRPSHALMRP